LFLIDAKETEKNIQTVMDICEKMTAMPSKRNTHLVSVGGGIVQDITGFVATSLYRGIRWTFYPSTLLAACDSCIGGKSSLNYKGFKNLLGSFYPPDSIRIYPQFFKTLTPRDYCSGLGEVVKFNVIAGRDGLQRIESDLDDILRHDYKKLSAYIKSSLEFKKNFIEEDEFDKGVRILLNFAHTFGHAYEVVSEYAVPHGSAVALGMITANYISVQRGYLPVAYAERIEKICQRILVHIEKKKEWFGLDRIFLAIHKDKKQTSAAITAVLIKQDYSLGVFHDVQEDEIAKAIEHLFV
jgi:3-dehydroquinate synthase